MSDPHNIAWGYNRADLDRLTRMALSRVRTRSGDSTDRYDAAWYAIVADLCTSKTRPGPSDLIETGQRAVDRYINEENRHRGYNLKTREDRVNYIAYWMPHPAPSPENHIIDRVALDQIMPHLTPAERRAVTVLGDTEDYALAAAAMGVSIASFTTRISAARKRFLEHWHDGETPSKVWRHYRRAPNRTGTVALTETQVEHLRDRYYQGESIRSIAAGHDLSHSTISRYLRGVIRPAPDPVEVP